MSSSVFTLALDTPPSWWEIKSIWPVISVFIEDYAGSDVLEYAQKCLENKASHLGANAILGFRLTSSSTYCNEYRITPEVFAYGNPVLFCNKIDEDNDEDEYEDGNENKDCK